MTKRNLIFGCVGVVTIFFLLLLGAGYKGYFSHSFGSIPFCSSRPADPKEALVTAEDAVKIALNLNSEDAQLYLAEHSDRVRLYDSCEKGLIWTIVISPSSTGWSDVFVDADTGEVVERRSFIPTL